MTKVSVHVGDPEIPENASADLHDRIRQGVGNMSRADRLQNIALVESAIALTDQERNEIASAVDKLIGHPVQLSYAVRPDVLGGLRITVGDWVLDTTLSGQLDDLKAQLL